MSPLRQRERRNTLGVRDEYGLEHDQMGNQAAIFSEVEQHSRERCPNSTIDDVSLPVGAVA
jgi:hypothetical protein